MINIFWGDFVKSSEECEYDSVKVIQGANGLVVRILSVILEFF